MLKNGDDFSNALLKTTVLDDFCDLAWKYGDDTAKLLTCSDDLVTAVSKLEQESAKQFVTIAAKQGDGFFNALKSCNGYLDDTVELTVKHGDEFAENTSFIYAHNIEKTQDELYSLYEAATRKNTRFFDDTTDSLLSDKIMSVRHDMPSKYKKSGNMASASFTDELAVKIEDDMLYAHSGINALEDLNTKEELLSDIVLKPEVNRFTYFELPSNLGADPYPRNIDSEYKLLCEIDKRIGNNFEVAGNVILLTEKPTCESCKNAIFEFLAKYKEITITVVDNGGTILY